MSPIDVVLARLEPYSLRQNGPDRWRACCAAHRGSNPSALSIGVGDDGRVLLKCWHGCSADEVVSSLGLDLSDLFPPMPAEGHGNAPLQRRHLLPARQALDLLHAEALVIGVAAADIANGLPLDQADCDRVMQAAGRIAYLRDEAMS